MRRWMIYDKLMNGQGKRHALVMNKQADNTYTTYLFDRDNTPMITNQNIYFLPMKRSEMSNNPNLEQTKGWGKRDVRPASWTLIPPTFNNESPPRSGRAFVIKLCFHRIPDMAGNNVRTGSR